MLFFLIPEETYNSEHLEDISLLVANISFSNLEKKKEKNVDSPINKHYIIFYSFMKSKKNVESVIFKMQQKDSK